jgi:hypothetical protein
MEIDGDPEHYEEELNKNGEEEDVQTRSIKKNDFFSTYA